MAAAVSYKCLHGVCCSFRKSRVRASSLPSPLLQQLLPFGPAALPVRLRQFEAFDGLPRRIHRLGQRQQTKKNGGQRWNSVAGRCGGLRDEQLRSQASLKKGNACIFALLIGNNTFK